MRPENREHRPGTDLPNDALSAPQIVRKGVHVLRQRAGRGSELFHPDREIVGLVVRAPRGGRGIANGFCDLTRVLGLLAQGVASPCDGEGDGRAANSDIS